MDFKYPYTDFHELNLDWFLAEFKKLTTEWLQMQEGWADEQQAFQDLKDYVNNYFVNLDVQEEINNKLDGMALNGQLGSIMSPYVTAELPSVVAAQLAPVVASQITAVVAGILPTVVSDQLGTVAPPIIADWLTAHIDPGSGYAIDNTLTVHNAAADAKVVGDRFARLDPVINRVDIDAVSAGYVYIPYKFEVGKKYLYENLYTDASVVDTTNQPSQSAPQVDSISSGGNNIKRLCFEPTASADYLRIFFNAANGKARISEIGTDDYRLREIDSAYPEVTRKQYFSTHNSANSVYYPMYAGKTYRIKNVSEVIGSGNYGIQLYTRTTPKGANVETITTSILPGEELTFTPSGDTDYVRYQADGGVLVNTSIEEIGTMLDWYENEGFEDYTSGQIHFTVPVNQKRLINTQGSAFVTEDDESIMVNVDSVLMLPTSYSKHGDPVPLLMICHGSSAGVTTTTWFGDDPTVLAFFGKFLAAGFAIFDCNGYKNGSTGQESWGVDTAALAYHAAYEYVTKHYNVQKSMCVYGFSMGGLNALNYCRMFPGNVKALGLGSPVVSLYDTVYVDESVAVKSAVAAAYGFASPSTYEPLKVGNCDPFVRIKQIGGVKYYADTLPTVKIWHGDQDTAVYYTHSQELNDAINNAGGFSYYRLVNGKGHEICYGGSNIISDEMVVYFNRFK